jgi:hypothetical protein
MSHGILPEGELLKRAVRWIGEQRQEQPSADVARLIDEASIRFDLPPNEEEFLFVMLAPERVVT